MLAIDHRLAAGRDRSPYARRNAVEVVLQRDAERDADVIVPAFGDEDDRVGSRGEQGGDSRIVAGRAARPFRHAERRETGALGRLRLEEFRVERIGAGIAALDIVDAEAVE